MSSARATAISTKVESNYHLDDNFRQWKLDIYSYLNNLLTHVEPDAAARKRLLLGKKDAENMQYFWMRSLTHYSMNKPGNPTCDYEELELIDDRVMGLNFTDYRMTEL